MDPPKPSKSDMPAKFAVLLAVIGLCLSGYPIAWIAFSPNSVLRSSNPDFVNGFGAGIGVGVSVPAGIVFLGFAWSNLMRRCSPGGRRSAERVALIGMLVMILVVSAVRAAR